MENQFLIDSEFLSPEILAKKHRLETDPSSRKSHMEYLPGMEVIESDVCEKVMSQMNAYDPSIYTAKNVKAALEHANCTLDDFKALLSPAAEPFLEQMAEKARGETGKHFGNTVYLFTPLYIANYCENYCVYCGFNCYNHINCMKLNMEQIEHEMKVIADSGMEEVLILTGESRGQSPVEYIGQAVKLARKYFRMVGLEIYPVNTDEYKYLHECGADYAKTFAIGVAKAKSVETANLFAKYIAVMNGELDVHSGYMGKFQVTQAEIDGVKPSLDNLSYTSYMLRVAYEEGEAEILAAILSCAYSYEVIAKKIVANAPNSVNDSFYGDWIKGYASEDYAADNVVLLDTLNALTQHYIEAQISHLVDIFVACSRYEWAFWQMSWEMKQ